MRLLAQMSEVHEFWYLNFFLLDEKLRLAYKATADGKFSEIFYHLAHNSSY